ncbi:MAG: hypothetical protein WD771_12085 [Gemmatimonadaceae bacterium]
MEHRAEPGRGRVVKRPQAWRLPTRRSGDPRASLVGLFVQLTVMAIVVPVLLVPVAWDFLLDDAGGRVVPERISFIVSLPTEGPAQREPARAGGDGRPLTETPPPAAPPIVAPTAVPTGVAPAPATPAPVGGLGPLIGGGGPLRGIQPTFTDQRLWVPHGDVVATPMVPLSRADTLRILLQRRAIAMMDSISSLPSDLGRLGDWTVNRNGKKYGIDGQFIRLGAFSIPTQLLALLPMNVQANPIAMERARRLDSMREEIETQANRSIRDEEFRKAVDALRARRERERRAAADSLN